MLPSSPAEARLAEARSLLRPFYFHPFLQLLLRTQPHQTMCPQMPASGSASREPDPRSRGRYFGRELGCLAKNLTTELNIWMDISSLTLLCGSVHSSSLQGMAHRRASFPLSSERSAGEGGSVRFHSFAPTCTGVWFRQEAVLPDLLPTNVLDLW